MLVSAYERGRLVPFLGAGMSYPACTLWNGFLSHLDKVAAQLEKAQAGVSHQPKFKEKSTARAYLSSVALRNKLTQEEYWGQLREALQPNPSRVIPVQTRNLARIWWPLVITTNYDDLFLTATRTSARSKMRFRRRWPMQPMHLVSRHPQDCRRILSSLVEPLIGIDETTMGEGVAPGSVVQEGSLPEHDPFAPEGAGSYLWHVQGFLGGQADPHSKPEERDPASSGPGFQSPLRFLEDLVIGHAEYRRVINTELQFRRCFGEVFRQRSFLFLGSSLEEDYFLNLFGEVLELFGSNPFPHFALVKRGSVDTRFLLERMNILVCEYEDHDQLPDWIARLGEAIHGDRCRATRFSFSVRSPFWLTSRRNEGDFAVLRSTLPFQKDIPKNHCVAVSAGRGPNREVWIGPEILQRYLKVQFPRLLPRLGRMRLPAGGYVLRLDTKRCYAVAARNPNRHGRAARSLEYLHPAVSALLDRVWNDGFEVVHMQLLAAGRLQIFPPTWSLIETARAFGQWRRRHPSRQLRLFVYVLDPLVLFNVSTGRLAFHELLSVDTASFWLEVVRAGNKVMRIPVQYACQTLLGEVLDEFRIPRSPEWHVWVRPAPRRMTANEPSSTQDLAEQPLTSLGIVPGSTLAFVDARPS